MSQHAESAYEPAAVSTAKRALMHGDSFLVVSECFRVRSRQLQSMVRVLRRLRLSRVASSTCCEL